MSDNIANLAESSEIVGNDKNFVRRIVQSGLTGVLIGQS
jgi:hypothetical protein